MTQSDINCGPRASTMPNVCAHVCANPPFFSFSFLKYPTLSCFLPHSWCLYLQVACTLPSALHLVFQRSLLQHGRKSHLAGVKLLGLHRWEADLEQIDLLDYFPIGCQRLDLAMGRFRFGCHLPLNLRLLSPTLQPLNVRARNIIVSHQLFDAFCVCVFSFLANVQQCPASRHCKSVSVWMNVNQDDVPRFRARRHKPTMSNEKHWFQFQEFFGGKG